ncbi:hypothetical protein MKEN_00578900 [Mycena kentingensis (nom. inval.)]|nr:hypothetical protein MKEN_00578900 [Mycena kentingensis (nom. inval.)]
MRKRRDSSASLAGAGSDDEESVDDYDRVALAPDAWAGNLGDVPLALASPPTTESPIASGVARDDDPHDPFNYAITNAPEAGMGYDICIECHKMAAFPSPAHLPAAENHVGMLEAMWAQRVAGQEDKRVRRPSTAERQYGYPPTVPEHPDSEERAADHERDVARARILKTVFEAAGADCARVDIGPHHTPSSPSRPHPFPLLPRFRASYEELHIPYTVPVSPTRRRDLAPAYPRPAYAPAKNSRLLFRRIHRLFPAGAFAAHGNPQAIAGGVPPSSCPPTSGRAATGSRMVRRASTSGNGNGNANAGTNEVVVVVPTPQIPSSQLRSRPSAKSISFAPSSSPHPMAISSARATKTRSGSRVLNIEDVCDDGIDPLEPQLEPICEWIKKAREEGGQVLGTAASEFCGARQWL